MEDIREGIHNGANWLREKLISQDRRVTAGLAIGAGAVAAVAELSARRLPDSNLFGRMASRSMRLIAAGSFALSAWQTERFGEQKQQPRPTSVEVTQGSIKELGLTIKQTIEGSNQYYKDGMQGPKTGASEISKQLAQEQHASAKGSAQAADILGLPAPEGFESWAKAVDSESEIPPAWLC